MGLATLASATVHFMSTAHISGVQALQLLATALLPYESFVEQQTCNAGLALSITVEWLAILLLVREISFSILSE
jgi:hypothetical protein